VPNFYQKISSGNNLWRLVPSTCFNTFGENIKKYKLIVAWFTCQKYLPSLPCCNCFVTNIKSVLYCSCGSEESWFDFLQGKEIYLLQNFRRVSETHTATIFSGESGRCVKLIAHTYLMPKLIKSGFNTILHPYISCRAQGQCHLYLSAFVGMVMTCHFIKLHMPIPKVL
jgi:hypothetical protein